MSKRFPVSIGILALILLAGCGGGGSDGVSAITYTGSTSQAVIADNNAEAIAIAAYQAGDMSSILAGPMSASPTAAAAGTPRVVTLVRTLQSVAQKTSSTGQTSLRPRSVTAPKEIISGTETLDDGLGGSATISLSVDNVTGDFTGSFTFQNWHGDAESVISGTAGVSGNLDLDTGSFTAIEFSFVSLTMEDPSASVTIGGTVAVVGSPSSSSAAINLVFRDNITGKTVWIRDYTMEAIAGPDVLPADGIPDYVDVSVAGRIYVHDYGYVDIDTPVPFRIYDGNLNPSSGTIVMTGGLGRSVQLIVIDEVSGFDLEADLEPDGFYEWTSPGHPWA